MKTNMCRIHSNLSKELGGHGLALWLEKNLYDEWVKIIRETKIDREVYESGLSEWTAYFTRLNERYQYDPMHEDLSPITTTHITSFLKIERYYVGNAEWPEIVRIDHLKPLRYLNNLRELSVCHNTIRSLEPIWGHTRLERLWIESTNIPQAEIEMFSIDHPNCKVETMVYL